MPEFVCRVGTPSGLVRQETHVAPDAETLRSELARRDLHVFDIRSSRAGLSIGKYRLGGSAKRVPRRQFLLFNQELVTLIRAGLPLLQCLDILLERMPETPFKRYLTDIRDRLRSGSSLSEAFQAQGEAFPRVYAASLTAGERSGELASVVGRYVEFVKKAEALRSRVTAALIYPALLTLMSVGLIALLMFYILPRFSSFYLEFGRDLPGITVFVMAIANFFRGNAFLIFGGLIAGLVALKLWHGTDSGRHAVDSAILRVPIVGSVLRRYHIAQFSRTLSTMLAGGIPLVSALQTTSGALGNEVFRSAVDRATDDVREGQSLWQSLDEAGAMSDMAIEMIKVGEATGALPQMLSDVAEFYDDQVDEAMTRVVSLFEPILLVVMGFIVAFILLAMYLPIFRLAGSA